MDRPITKTGKQKFIQRFDLLDLFPYSLAAIMFAGEIYILHQFVALTTALQH